ncbi:MAG: F420-0--gamma-glutamyl ligase [Candidatus Staskawiczbacteria bacterium]|nr:F420-0--gamma-glutamyl ligase [Candidatus Staskawiczbacteria bacterium]
MQLQPNNGKNLTIEVENRKFARYPVKTKLITPQDKDISVIVVEYAKPHIQKGDVLFVSEKAVAITQGRAYDIKDIKASWLAHKLSKYVTKTPVGIGLGSPETMQLALEEVGALRILLASIIGGLGKILGIRGLFYIVAGHGARSIDGAVPYTIPPYNNYVSKGPEHADQVAQKIFEKVGIPVAVVDANDIGVNILGVTHNLRKKLIASIIKDNPLGQSDEQTPIGIIREIL